MTQYSKCDNCGHIDEDLDIGSITDLYHRIDPGGVVPAGECTKCAALSYLCKLTQAQLGDMVGAELEYAGAKEALADLVLEIAKDRVRDVNRAGLERQLEFLAAHGFDRMYVVKHLRECRG